ncbi:MAG: putative integrase [Prokaryotic dsDNA virus sp.]|nr:MAG: putative integrase [Prokaryotic dsDNA virus sp.]|tara:strand:+ start:18981 stop:20135 length:1155 start_codon:yes stop_codon:yes gene_type:complete
MATKKYPYLLVRERKGGTKYYSQFKHQGKPVQIPLECSSTIEAAKLAIEKRDEYLAGTITLRKDAILFEDAAYNFLHDRFGWFHPEKDLTNLTHIKELNTKSEKYAKDHMKVVRRILPVFRGVNLLDMSNETIHAYVQSRRLDKNVQGSYITGRTILGDLQTLSSIFTHAKRTTSVIKTNPIRDYDKSDFTLVERTRFLELEEMERLLAASRKCCNPDMHDIILMAFLMGLRQGELFLNRWDYLEIENQTSGYQFRLPPEICKGNKERVVPVPQEFVPTLKRMMSEPRCPDAYVFWNQRSRTHYKDLKRAWQETKEFAKVTDFRFHDLRHTYAAHRLRRGMSLAYLSKIMGHNDISQTMKYANHASKDLHDATASAPIELQIAV